MKKRILIFCTLCVLVFTSTSLAFNVSGTVHGFHRAVSDIQVVAVPMTFDTIYALIPPLIEVPPFLLDSTYTHVLDSGSYIFFAYQDLNTNLTPDLDEPRGFYGSGLGIGLPELLPISHDTAGIDITLNDPNSGGFTGTISYDDTTGGMTYVVASRTADFSGLPAGIGAVLNTSGVGSYTAMVDSFGIYYAYAYKDVNGNLVHDADEPYGVYGGETPQQINIQQNNFPSNVDITLLNPPPNAVGVNPIIPQQYMMGQAYPNPFNAETTIPFSLAKASEIELSVYNMLGQKILRLADGYFAAGGHAVKFNAADYATGLYIVELKVEGHLLNQKLLLLK
jgi:hypothetical protein